MRRVINIAFALWLLTTPAVPCAQPGGLPPTALMVAIAYDGQTEVGYFHGPIDWPKAMPVYYTGVASETDGKVRWRWSDIEGRELRVESTTRAKGGGMAVEDWARQKGANRLEISLIEHPDPPAETASDQGQGTTGQGRGPDPSRHRQARKAAVGDERAQAQEGFERGTETGQLDAYEDGTGGQGERANGGEVRGHGKGAEQAGSGRDNGREKGQGNGSEQQSWQPKDTGATEISGQLGSEQGMSHGGAGGDMEARGHVRGSGWLSWFDFPMSVAAVVNVALLGLEADIAGIGGRLFKKVIDGASRAYLKRVMKAEIDEVVARAVRETREQVAKEHGLGPLALRERERLLRDVEREFPGEAYARLKRHAEDKALRYEQTAQGLQGKTRRAEVRTRELCQENARAYRAIEKSAAKSAEQAAQAAFVQRQKAFVQGYRKANPRSGLTDQEILDYQRLGYQYKPDTGALYHPNSGAFPAPVEPNLAVYKSGSGQLQVRKHLSASDAKALDAAQKARKQASDEIDALSKKAETGAAELAALNEKRAAMRDASEELGELAGQAYAAKELVPKGFERLPLPAHQANNFDQVYFNPKTGEVMVIECKGGAGRLGTRFGEKGERVQQGSGNYLKAIIAELKKTSASAAIRIQRALQGQKLRYLEIRQGIKDDGSLTQAIVREFDLSS